MHGMVLRWLVLLLHLLWPTHHYCACLLLLLRTETCLLRTHAYLLLQGHGGDRQLLELGLMLRVERR